MYGAFLRLDLGGELGPVLAEEDKDAWSSIDSTVEASTSTSPQFVLGLQGVPIHQFIHLSAPPLLVVAG